MFSYLSRTVNLIFIKAKRHKLDILRTGLITVSIFILIFAGTRIFGNVTNGVLSFEETIVAESSLRPSNPHSKTIGDIDKDGQLDVVAASSNNGPMVWYKQSADNASWNSHTINSAGSWTTDMQAGDIDGDNDLDIIVPKADGLYWYKNPLPATNPNTVNSWDEQLIGTEGANNHDLELGDINKDGKLDVVSRPKSNRNSPAVTYVWLQTNSNWSLQTIRYGLKYKGEGMALGDIDNDNDLDIAQNGYWLENQNFGTDWTALHVVDSLYFHPVNENNDSIRQADVGVTIADLDSDSKADIIIGPSERFNGYLSWYRSGENPKTGPNGKWQKLTIDTGVSYLHTFKTADLDLDGNLDVVVAEMHQTYTQHGLPSRVMVYLNPKNSTTSEWSKHIVSTTGSHNIRLGDFDNDGDTDIVGANWNNESSTISAPDGAKIYLWRNLINNGSTPPSLNNFQRKVIGQHDNTDGNSQKHSIFVQPADLDGDGLVDLISGPNIFFNSGSINTAWQKTTIGTGFENVAAVFDIDNDGKLDIIGTDQSTIQRNTFHQLVWARNNGNKTFTIHKILGANDGDFLQGIVIDRFQAGKLAIALSWHRPRNDEDPATTLGQEPGIYLLTVPESPTADVEWSKIKISNVTQNEELSKGDIDRDGLTDLLLGTKWLKNNGTDWQLHTLFEPPASTSGEPLDRNRLVDINNDGRLDSVVGYEANALTDATSRLAWYRQPETATNPWSEIIINPALKGPMSLDTRDLDSDGDIDVIVGEHDLRTGARPRLLIYENLNGTGQEFQEHIVYSGDEHHDGAQVSDLDKDSDLDIISIGWSHPNILVYENQAKNPTSPTPLPPTATPPALTPTPTPSPTPTPTPVPSANLAPNPSFETNPSTYYFTHGTGTFTWAGDAFNSGTKSLKIISTSTGTDLTRWLSITNKITAEPNKLYQATVYIKTNNVIKNSLLALNFWDANSQVLKTYLSPTLTGTNNWKQLTIEGLAPANTKYIRVEFRLIGSGTIWADDVKLIRK